MILVALQLTDTDRMTEPMASVLETVKRESVVDEIWSGGLPMLKIDPASHSKPKLAVMRS